MSYEQHIGVIDEESVMVECGPMRLVIRAWYKDRPQIMLAHQVAEESISYLERIARCRSLLSRPWPHIDDVLENEFAHCMLRSVEAIGDDNLTPMAAVAGTIADAVANWLFEREVTKVIVDNGGDISIRLVDNETVSVGIRPDVSSSEISHVVCLDAGRRTYGVTTSGVGGRSFTQGIASAVTVLAASASLADAASTAIANACFVEDNAITQMPAERFDPNSDLVGTEVTTQVGTLSSDKIFMAIESARQKADHLNQKGVIVGAFIALKGQFVITDGLQPYISQVK